VHHRGSSIHWQADDSLLTRKRSVAPLECIVCPEGHVMQGKQIKVSGTLGAPSAS
jgi:hypothetical protein